jgi:hypothetical protein
MKVLTIIQEDRPGLLAEVTALLARENIAVQDFTGTSVGDTAVLTLTVGPYRRAFRLLSKAGYRVVASEHLLVRIERRPGALAELSRKLADADIDVRGMHIVNKDERAGIVALETADYDKAREVLQDILV